VVVEVVILMELVVHLVALAVVVEDLMLEVLVLEVLELLDRATLVEMV
jgi:hypothetical protein